MEASKSSIKKVKNKETAFVNRAVKDIMEKTKFYGNSLSLRRLFLSYITSQLTISKDLCPLMINYSKSTHQGRTNLC